jgi:hypothetical protein
MFAKAVTNQWTVTENGMKARVSSASACVDLFYRGGASRDSDIIPYFSAALATNKELAMRIALWIRDVRGGAGERETFRNILRYLDKTNVDLAIALINRVPELGRWDDMLVVESPRAWDHAVGMIQTALVMKPRTSYEASYHGLCGKWMPRKGPIAVKLTKSMGLTPKQYRQLIVSQTNVVENQMCKKEWNRINYGHVPSVASARYRAAFRRNDGERYAQYVKDLSEGTAKVNAGAIFPHDVIKNLIDRYADSIDEVERHFTIEQWNRLPNYIGDNSVLPMVDVSGSMSGVNVSPSTTALHVAVSLGLYASDKNKGEFKDLILTFSSNPSLMRLTGNIAQKVEQLKTAHWSMSTNLEAALKLVLQVAVDGSVPQEHMPKFLLILSDMQFNEAVSSSVRPGSPFFLEAGEPNLSAFELAKTLYAQAGYTMPKIVFWNLASRDANVPVSFRDQNVALVSGFSPAILKAVLSGNLEDFTPESVMMTTVMDERYRWR